MQRDVLTLYVGIMLGVLGNLFTSLGIELAKAAWEKSDIIWYWAITFVISSTLFFQITKWIMRRLGIAKLRAFDLVTIIFILLGIFIIVLDKFLR